METDWVVVATIAAPLISLVAGAVLDRAIESRPRLVTYLGHVSAHRLRPAQGNPHDVYTHSVVLRNTGRKPAKNVRLAHPILPEFTVYPDIEHRVENLPGGGREILIPNLVPGEQVTISYLYFPPVTWGQVNGPVKSDEGLARVLRVLPTQQLPAWLNLLGGGLTLAGFVAVLYAIYTLVRWLLGGAD